MGNTCYMNVVLQAFTHNPLLQYYFFLAKGHGSILCKQTRKQQTPPSVCLGCELGDFMATMSPATASSANSSMLASLSSPSFVPHKLLESFWNFAPSFIGSQQHDAHEFFLEFLRGLHSHTHARVSVPGGVSPRFTPTGKSLCDCAVHQHYAGVLQSQVECVVCDQVSSTFDPFLDVSLSLEDMDDGDDGQQSLALTDLLAKFTADEQLRGINRVYCRRCNAYANMLKRLRFHALPNVLVLHIKRLDFHKQRKLSRYVQFPATKLDLEEFRSEPGDACDQDPVTPRAKTQNGNKDAADASLYDLAAVINHHGDSVEGGHYTAFVQTRNENDCGNDRRKESKPQWLLFDDTDVSRVREEQVLSSQAYMLYYVRRRPRILA
uniref:ubiquitinyl hydrolase 1 n=1 Tax=Globisporangium ultimum (strain ATCC 200006 / CBS 805.95 / DAOM BR144) TaxID=431595 RepID=K3X707_GLOUD